MYDYDEEATIQEADIEMAEVWRSNVRYNVAHKIGACLHQGGYSYMSPPVYPEQALIKPGEFICYDCHAIFPSEDAWYEFLAGIDDMMMSDLRALPKTLEYLAWKKAGTL